MSNNGRKRPTLVADRRYGAAGKPKPKPKKRATTGKAKSTARRKSTPRKPTKKRGPIGRLFPFFGRILRRIFGLIWGFFWRAGMAVVVLTGIGVFYYASTLPEISDLVDARTRGSVTLLDRNGQTFAWRGDQFGGVVTATTVSPHLHNAVVATEDKRFYSHLGISPRGIASAVRINLRAGRGPLSGNGGSTITQQVAKLLCLGTPYDPNIWETEAAYEADCRRTTLWRKVKEAVYSLALETKYSKEEILTIYLNRAYLGAGSRGFEAAANRYFGHSAAEVIPAEAAMLAGLLKAPSTYAPTNNLERSQNRAGVVIDLMEDQGYLSASAAAEARANPAALSPAAAARAGGYFADWVMESGPEFFTRNTTEDVIISTTLDQDIQTAAEEALAFIFDTKVREGSAAQAAIVVMSENGEVRAMVGGRATGVSGVFNRATQANRQPGSAFKPFIYAAALENGASPLELIQDAPICIDVPGPDDWCPRNYSNEYLGPVTLTEALTRSLNTPAVRLYEQLGRTPVNDIAARFGIASDIAVGPAVALGASEVTLLEITGAYAGFLNGGYSVTPFGLRELTFIGADEALMRTETGLGDRVISKAAAQQLAWMMMQVVENGTGARAQLEGRDVAGKTGTTQAARDAWFIGFTGDYITGVWMGYDDNTPLTGVTGSGLPAEIWHETMSRVHEGTPITSIPVLVPIPPEKLDTLQTSPPPEQDQQLLDLLNQLINGN